MKIVLQRVIRANVKTNNEIIGEISKGYLILLGIGKNDTEKDIDYLIEKIINLRIFEDANNKFNLSLKDINADILLISQFTLYADCSKGRRPAFIDAMHPDQAKIIYDLFVEKLKQSYKENEISGEIATGEFGAMMDVELINQGPVTLVLNSK